MVTHMGRGVLEAQSCQCVCRNASRGLSAIAEFLVIGWNDKQQCQCSSEAVNKNKYTVRVWSFAEVCVYVLASQSLLLTSLYRIIVKVCVHVLASQSLLLTSLYRIIVKVCVHVLASHSLLLTSLYRIIVKVCVYVLASHSLLLTSLYRIIVKVCVHVLASQSLLLTSLYRIIVKVVSMCLHRSPCYLHHYTE